MRRTSQLVGLDFSTGRSISLLPVMASVAKARLIFMTFRELRLTRTLNWRNAFSYLRVREAILASLGNWASIESKDQSRVSASTISIKTAVIFTFRSRVQPNGLQMGCTNHAEFRRARAEGDRETRKVHD